MRGEEDLPPIGRAFFLVGEGDLPHVGRGTVDRTIIRLTSLLLGRTVSAAPSVRAASLRRG
jgi:hypothetical protein